MNFKEILKDAIRTNTKLIITGKSGYGKSEMIKQVADEIGYELIDFRLSEILPEDLVGLPKIIDGQNYYEYIPPRWVYEVLQNPDKNYILFLDEITQGTPEVLNICYKIFDKVTKVGNYELPNVVVVGATNYSDESNYINELPKPLQNRACMLELDHTSAVYRKFLMDKYNLPKEIETTLQGIISETNPRSTDKAIDLITANANPQLVIAYIGQTNYETLTNYIKGNIDYSTISNLDKAKQDIKNGCTKIKNKIYFIDDAYELKLLYDLTDEEYSLIQEMYRKEYQPKGSLNYNLLERIFRDKDGITAEDLRKSPIAFNVNTYISITSVSNKEIPRYDELLKFKHETSYTFFHTRKSLLKMVENYASDTFKKHFGL